MPKIRGSLPKIQRFKKNNNTTGTRVWVNSSSRVRIPPSPPD